MYYFFQIYLLIELETPEQKLDSAQALENTDLFQLKPSLVKKKLTQCNICNHCVKSLT